MNKMSEGIHQEKKNLEISRENSQNVPIQRDLNTKLPGYLCQQNPCDEQFKQPFQKNNDQNNESEKILLKSSETFSKCRIPTLKADGRGDYVDYYFPNYLIEKRMEQLNKNGMPLRLFDLFRRPVTDCQGYPLTDIKGESLIVFDENHTPCGTSYGSSLFDAKAIEFGNQEFQPTTEPKSSTRKKPIRDIDGRQILLFDKRGYPLTNLDGIPITCSRGKLLISKENERLVDSFGHPVIKIYKQFYYPSNFQSIRDSNGNPARLFDKTGRPLTSSLGEPLTNIEGIFLLEFDVQGSPISDWVGNPVYDERGLTIRNEGFNPCLKSEDISNAKPIVDWVRQRITLYDKSGLPLTDIRGKPLVTARDVQMVIVDRENVPVSDYAGNRLFDSTSLPLIKTLKDPIIGPNGAPARIFDANGSPLTDSHGLCLKCINGENVIITDKIGKIKTTFKRGEIYDCNLTPMCNEYTFNPYKTPLNEMNASPISVVGRLPVPLYNYNGYPLTDQSGRAVVNRKGEFLVCLNQSGSELLDINGNPVYDVMGSVYYYKKQEIRDKAILFDSKGRPLTDSKGNILKSRLGVSLINLDEQDNPMGDLFMGKIFISKGREYDGTVLKTTKMRKAKKNKKLNLNRKVKVFDYMDLPLLDDSGAVLFNWSDEAMIKLDRDGKLLSDVNGGPLFDENAVPLTKTTIGAWVDKSGKPLYLFDEDKRPLTDEKGKPINDIQGNSLVNEDEFGRPLKDWLGRVVFDALGIPIGNFRFEGSLKPVEIAEKEAILDHRRNGVRLFDCEGLPLTNEKGFPLVNSDGVQLIREDRKTNKWEDWKGGRVYDFRKLPLGSMMGREILSMNGKPIRLYDEEGHPLTGLNGAPLRFASGSPMILFDKLGLPKSDLKKRKLYDGEGRSTEHSFFHPEGSMENNAVYLVAEGDIPLKIFDKKGKPLTDSRGYLLYNRQRDRLKYRGRHPSSGINTNIYDEYGNITILKINDSQKILVVKSK